MRQKRISKFLSYVLRHKPEAIDLTMDQNGWVDINELIEKMNQNGKDVSLEELFDVVKHNQKQRFKVDEVHNRIRANQGHSIKVDIELVEKRPPAILYHGTAIKNRDQILAEGLKKMDRQHVHLSGDYKTAIQVGSRHGKPMVLKIDCEKMIADGLKFYLSENNVWLTDAVHPKYIE